MSQRNSNQSSRKFSNDNPLHLPIHLPNSNPNSGSNLNSIRNPSPKPNPNSSSIPDHLIPRKTKRGKLSKSHDESSNLSKTNLNNNSLNASRKAVSDASDEITVIKEHEALTALSAGFPSSALTNEEIEAGVVSVIGGIEQDNYILIRNHIITKWRKNVLNWVTKEMFLDVIPKHVTGLFNSAYNFLVSHGYINFGVAPTIKDRINSAELSKGMVIIIGAGLAGLAAARQLMSFGFTVVVLEGRKRAGGRVYTETMEGGNQVAAADLGGSVLTGTLGNPLGILAQQLSYTLHKVRDNCALYRADGKPVDRDLDEKVEAAFNTLLEKASNLKQLMGDVSQDVSLGAALDTFQEVLGYAVNDEEMSLFNWHLANLEYANAGLLSKLSLAFWDQDDVYDMGGDHCFVSGGNGRLVQALAENVPIIFETTVEAVNYGSDGVQVVADGQVFKGDMALCTIPLGVLKRGSIKFNPELPQRKLGAIKRLGFGLLNKIALLFPYVFWDANVDTFGHVIGDPGCRGEFFLFFNYTTVAGGPLLIALVAGDAAHKFEIMHLNDAVARVIQIFKGICDPQEVKVPLPVDAVRTTWGSDRFSFGSYSNVAVGASGDDYDILAETVGEGRLFFAGEVTNRLYPANMHGAFLTGHREAANLAHHTTLRTSRLEVEQKNPSMDAHTYADLLADLFREPDMEFGSFSIISAGEHSGLKSTEILRITLNGSEKTSRNQLRSNHQQEIHVYSVLTKDQALELREVRGGDDMRLNFLTERLGIKLAGRKGLGSSADLIIASVKAERGKGKPSCNPVKSKSDLEKFVATIL